MKWRCKGKTKRDFGEERVVWVLGTKNAIIRKKNKGGLSYKRFQNFKRPKKGVSKIKMGHFLLSSVKGMGQGQGQGERERGYHHTCGCIHRGRVGARARAFFVHFIFLIAFLSSEATFILLHSFLTNLAFQSSFFLPHFLCFLPFL